MAYLQSAASQGEARTASRFFAVPLLVIFVILGLLCDLSLIADF